MKLVFVAGPYFADGSYRAIDKNIAAAELVAIQLANRQIPFFCPHIHTAHFEVKASAPESFYRGLALEILPTCGAMVLLPRWETSRGTQKEIEQAKLLNIPIFYSLESLCSYLGIK